MIFDECWVYEEDENVNGGFGEWFSVLVFRDWLLMEFEGYIGEVLDFSWSKNNFLLLFLMDKIVRLWYFS